MKPTELKALIEARVKAGIERPLLIEGPPGGGKTAIPGQVAKALGIDYRVIHAPLMQPEDYGFPIVTADKTDVNFIVSKDKFPMVGSDCPDTGILLIDELPQADPSGQKVLANLIHAREIHGQKLKPGWTVIATGNRAKDRAGANRLLSHLRNRMTPVELETSINDWKLWALANGIEMEVISFINFRPGLLHAFDPQQENNPTPRSWSEGVSASLGVVDKSVEFEVFKGDVGEGAAAEFLGYLKIFRSLVSPDVILLNPSGAPVPIEPSTLYAMAGSLASKATPNNFDRIMTYVERMPQEFGVLFVRDAVKRDPDLQTTPSFVKWIATNDNLLS